MGDLKGLAEIVDRLAYELLGLFIPGAVFVAAISFLLTPELRESGIGLANGSPWLAVGMCYVVGYFVQGVSRPISGATKWAFRPISFASGWITAKLKAYWTSKHSGAEARQKPMADLQEVARELWIQRLAVPEGQQLGQRDLIDLSYSTLGEERNRFLRFRSAGSLCRGVAATSALTFWAIVVSGFVGWPPGFEAVLLAVGSLVGFWAFSERASMYDDVWNAAVIAQFVAGRHKE